MGITTALLISFISGISTVLGSLFIFIKISKIKKFITICLSFSIAIMIGISITDLIPTAFYNILFSIRFPSNIILSLLFPILGGILVILINKYITNSDSLYKVGIISMIALIMHNLPEGIITFMGSIKDPSLGIKLSLAIMLHNIPEGISIAIPIYYSSKNKKKAMFYTLLSGLSEPFGAIISYLFLNKYINDLILNLILLLVSGIMITLSIHEILPSVLKYKEYRYIYYGLIIGIIIIILNHFLL